MLDFTSGDKICMYWKNEQGTISSYEYKNKLWVGTINTITTWFLDSVTTNCETGSNMMIFTTTPTKAQMPGLNTIHVQQPLVRYPITLKLLNKHNEDPTSGNKINVTGIEILLMVVEYMDPRNLFHSFFGILTLAHFALKIFFLLVCNLTCIYSKIIDMLFVLFESIYIIWNTYMTCRLRNVYRYICTTSLHWKQHISASIYTCTCTYCTIYTSESSIFNG